MQQVECYQECDIVVIEGVSLPFQSQRSAHTHSTQTFSQTIVVQQIRSAGMNPEGTVSLYLRAEQGSDEPISWAVAPLLA